MSLYSSSNQGKGRRIIRIGAQATPGAAEDLTGLNAKAAYVTDFSINPQREVIERRLISPEQHGIPSIVTSESVAVSMTGDIVLQNITSANASDLPIGGFHEALVGSGWELTSDNTDDTHTYVLSSGQGTELTFRQYMLNVDNSKYRIKQAYNVRGDLSISANAGEVVTYTFDGLGQNSINAVETLVEEAYAGSITFPSATQQPLVLKNCTVQIYNIDEDLVYDGGTLGTPETDGNFLGFTFNANRNPALRKNANATDAISGAYLDPDRPSLDVVVEMNDLIIDQFQKNRDAFEIRITIPQPGNNNNTMTLVCYAHLDGELAEAEVGDGIYNVTLPFLLSYPPNVAGNSPEAGTNPWQAWGTASNRGVPLLPASTLPIGLAVIQIRTASE